MNIRCAIVTCTTIFFGTSLHRDLLAIAAASLIFHEALYTMLVQVKRR